MRVRFSPVMMAIVAFTASAFPARAQTDLTPNIGAAPWSVDRAPAANKQIVNSFQGRDGVLQMTVDPSVATTDGFYRYKGYQAPVLGVLDAVPNAWTIQASFFVDAALQENPGGYDFELWIRRNYAGGSNDENTAAYDIIRWTSGQYSIWDDVNGWVNKSGTTNYGDWNDLSFTYFLNTDQINYGVNNEMIYDTSGGGKAVPTTIFDEIRYADGAGTFTTSMANTQATPEPASLLLLGSGLLGLGAKLRRRRKTTEPV